MKNVVVLIADIVNSRAIEDRRTFQRKLKATIEAVNRQSKASHLSPITLTLGDEFQAVYGDFRTLFPDMIEIMTSVHPYQLRIAIAHGPLSTDINPKAALEMDGRAFVQARMLMDKLKSIDRTVIEITTTEIFHPELTNLCLSLLCKEIARWKFNTLKIFNSMLKGVEKKQIAQELAITKRAVYKQIAIHDLDEYAELLDHVVAHNKLNSRSQETNYAMGLSASLKYALYLVYAGLTISTNIVATYRFNSYRLLHEPIE